LAAFSAAQKYALRLLNLQLRPGLSSWIYGITLAFIAVVTGPYQFIPGEVQNPSG
jgi:hypothetical protein